MVAYGALVPRAALDVPAHGWVNLHFSLLPAWRGAAPVQAALRHGDDITGATTFLLEEGLDTGPVFGVVTEAVRADDTAGALLRRLADSGAALLSATLDGIADGTLSPRPQPSDGVSHAPKVTVADAARRLGRAAHADRPARPLGHPEPGAWTTFRDERLGIGPVRTAADAARAEARRAARREAAGARRHRRRAARARRGAARRQARDARARLGPRRAHRARRAAAMTPRRAARPPGGPRAGSGPPRGRTGPARPPEIDPSRLAALELLTAVRVRDAYANLALPAILRRHRLRDRDAALATELGYGTLRARGLLDAVIEECTDRPLVRVEPTLLDALRLGAYQLLRTRVPPHAAVDTTVELVRVEAGSRAAGFVNAVLRRVGERDETGVGAAAGAGRRGGPARATRRSRTPTRAGSRRPSPTRWAARPSSTRRSPPTTPARPCTCSPGRARSRPRSWPS